MVGYKKNRAPKQKPEDFIGQTFNDGKLKVIGIAGKQGSNTLFKVTCEVCSPDTELYPEGYFVSQKRPLCDGQYPCGCSVKHSLKKEQWLIKVQRIGKEKGFIVHGFAEEFKGNKTKLDCECLIDGNKWTPNINHVINDGCGCPKCSGVYKPTEQEALDKCIKICDDMNYTFIGFVGKYKNVKSSKFEYMCPVHGKQVVGYSSFVNTGARCPCCSDSGYNPEKQGSFYVTKWTKDNHSFIKFGITNRKVLTRIKQQSRKTKYKYEILFEKTWGDGYIPLNIEKLIKSSDIFTMSIIDKEYFRDGFTETINIENVNDLKTIVFDYISSNLTVGGREEMLCQ